MYKTEHFNYVQPITCQIYPNKDDFFKGPIRTITSMSLLSISASIFMHTHAHTHIPFSLQVCRRLLNQCFWLSCILSLLQATGSPPWSRVSIGRADATDSSHLMWRRERNLGHLHTVSEHCACYLRLCLCVCACDLSNKEKDASNGIGISISEEI